MKRILSGLLCLAMLLCLVPAASAADGVITSSIAGGKAVYVNMTGYTGEVVLGNGSVVDDAPAANMVTGSVAAINGGFFNSYYSGNGDSFPGNCPIIYGAITKNGAVINGGGASNSIAFTYDGKVLIDHVDVSTTAVITGRNNMPVWSVNKVYTEPTSVTLMTPELTLPFTVPAGATIFTIRDDKVVSATVSGGGSYTATAGTKLLIYNSGAMANSQKYDLQPRVGDTVKFAYSYSPVRTADQNDWNNVKTMITGGRMLVQNGYNVTSNATYNEEIDKNSDAKQSNTGVSGRSYAAVMKDGRLVLGTANASFPGLADSLIQAGAVNAVSLDGGASSMLYANGSMLVPAGRQLASVLTVVPKNGSETKPEDVVIQTIDKNPNKPSDWARSDVEQAQRLDLIPEWLLNNYRNPITRAEFCATLSYLFRPCCGKTMDSMRNERGITGAAYDAISFTDVSKSNGYFILGCAALGIVNGYKDGSFKPNNTITRAEAAAIMERAVRLMGTVPAGGSKTFNDMDNAKWAKDSVDFVTARGIMSGVGSGNFNPNGTYTREQAFVTMMKTYRAFQE